MCENLKCLGIKIDDSKNEEAFGKYAKISTDDSLVDVYVVPTDEELLIARDTLHFIQNV